MRHLPFHNRIRISYVQLFKDAGHLFGSFVDGVDGRVVEFDGSFAHGMENPATMVVFLFGDDFQIVQREMVDVAIEMIHLFTLSTWANPYLHHEDVDGVGVVLEGDVGVTAAVVDTIAREHALAAFAGEVDS